MKSTKIIVDRAGISKGYGFVTFETEQEALRLQNEVRFYIYKFFLESCTQFGFFQTECVVLHDRKLNIAPAIKKQAVCVPSGTMYYPGNAIPVNNIAVDHFAAMYPPPGLPAIYPPGLHYQQFYPYYSLPLVRCF